ncbi:MAG: SH3 domain-containing protein [Anaerolineae bacterium]
MQSTSHTLVRGTLVGLALVMLALLVTAGSFAQDAGPTPTSIFDNSRGPTVTPVVTSTAPASLSGVNGYAERSAVSVRSGPGINYPRIGFLPMGQSIDIIGYNGYSLSRPCSQYFQNDLDMWVAVNYRGGTGWMARCALRITNEGTLARMLLNAPPPGAPLPTGFPTPR